MDLTHLSLFSGIGGIDLAAEWAGFQTVAFCEKDKYCQKVLAKHWPGVPIYDDARTTDFRSHRGVCLLTGGFPCQPYSQAGQRRGADNDRALWPEMRRAIRESRPAWVVGENVAGFVSMGLDSCLSDLEDEGYAVQAFLIPACGVGAYHQRYRVFVVANARSGGCDARSLLCAGSKPRSPFVGDSGETMADSHAAGRGELRVGEPRAKKINALECSCNDPNADRDHRFGRGGNVQVGWGWREKEACVPVHKGRDQWSVEPNVGRVAHGVPSRVDRLRALGNAVVPQQVYPIPQAIADSCIRPENLVS